MALPALIQAAITRIRGANNNVWNAVSNPFGHGQGGHRQNFIPDMNAVLDIALFVIDQAFAADADATQTAADRAQTGQDRAAASNSATAAAQSVTDAAGQVSLAANQVGLAKAQADRAAAAVGQITNDLASDPVGRASLPASKDIVFAEGLIPVGLSVLRSTVGTRRNRFGLEEVIPAGSLRHQFTPSGRYLGVLAEGQRTNSLLFCQDLSNAAWVKRGGLSPVGGQLAPDGTSTAWLINGLGGAGGTDPNFYQIVPATTGVVRSPAFWISRVSTSGTLILANPAAAPGLWRVNLALVPDGWQRITANHPAVTVDQEFTSGGAGNGHFYYTDGGASLSFRWWRGQLQDGPSVTSDIVTTDSAVTRAAENLTMPLLASDWNPSEGTVLIRARTGPLDGGFPRLWSVEGSSGNAMLIYRNASGNIQSQINLNGVAQADFAFQTVEAETFISVALAWRENSFAISMNGSTPLTDTSGSIPTSLTTERLGLEGAWVIYGLARWPRRLSNDELQNMTKAVA